MKMNKFRNKNGDLTRYAFVCGYVQEQKIEPFTKQLFMEHRTFHIQVTEEGKVGYAVWKTFDNDELTKARRFFRGIYCVTDSKGNHSLLIR